MKLMEKLKNALFEEEYVDVEEVPKEKKKKEKKERSFLKKEKPKENTIEQIKKKGREQAREVEEEKPIVKKIATPKEPKEEEKLEELEDFEEDRNELKGNNNFKFQEILDDDFSYQREEPQPKPVTRLRSQKPQPKQVEPKEVKPLYSGGKKEETFGFEKNYNTSHSYEKRPTKSSFKPSPIISPIYGVLDKNYQKEEIVSKKEIRMPSFESEHLDIDEVRNRAYGIKPNNNILFDVEDNNMNDVEEDITIEENDDLLDLTDQNETPSVSKVTVGDAEEYFEDLGLEYNNDYIDVSKEKATGRRVTENKKTREKIEVENDVVEEQAPIEEEKSDNENLFDLIDSMYEKE